MKIKLRLDKYDDYSMVGTEWAIGGKIWYVKRCFKIFNLSIIILEQ